MYLYTRCCEHCACDVIRSSCAGRRNHSRAVASGDVIAVNRKQIDTAMSTVSVVSSVSRLSTAALDRLPVRHHQSVCSTATIIVVAVLFLCTLPMVVDAKPVCGSKDFYVVRGQCFPCSTCPDYLIVRRPCTHDSDTLCGPLYDFEFLNVLNGGVGKASGGHRRRGKSDHQPAEASTLSNAAMNVHSDDSGSSAPCCYSCLIYTRPRLEYVISYCGCVLLPRCYRP